PAVETTSMMKRLQKVILMITSLLISLGAASGASIEAKLEIAPTHTLPGLPVMFVLTLKNVGKDPAVVRDGLNLNVRRADGSSFLVDWGNGDETTAIPRESGENQVMIAPGETRA